MSQAAIANSIRARFKAEVADEVEGLVVLYDNHRDSAVPGTGRWVRFSIRFGETFQATFANVGSRTFRTAGVAYAELYEPEGVGDGGQLALADTIIAAFRGVSLASPQIVFDSPSVAEGSRDGPWWRRLVTIPFRADIHA